MIVYTSLCFILIGWRAAYATTNNMTDVFNCIHATVMDCRTECQNKVADGKGALSTVCWKYEYLKRERRFVECTAEEFGISECFAGTMDQLRSILHIEDALNSLELASYRQKMQASQTCFNKCLNSTRTQLALHHCQNGCAKPDAELGQKLELCLGSASFRYPSDSLMACFKSLFQEAAI